ncbi:MAG: acyl carrier protein [Polyangiaceae bacterium]|nr:acyl carrier protein [Polyangiaceae bacterium]
MTREALRAAIDAALRSVAPESDPARLADDADLRETLDLDSMDFLSFVVALHRATGVDIPERDYARLATLEGAVQYLGPRVPSG